MGKNSKTLKLKNSNSQAITEPKIDFGTKFIRSCFHLLFFITPLLLWPFTTEVFEFNKMIFVYLITTIIATAWLIDNLAKQKFTIVKTPLDIPLTLFFTTQLISTLFSIDKHTSLWGYYSRFHGGLVSTICYIILFYAFTTYFNGDAKATKSIIKTIITTACLTAIYAVLEHFGIDKNVWVQDVQNRVFSTLGQPNWLSAYLIAILPLSIFLSFNKNKTHYLYLFTFVLFLISIVFTKSQSGLAATAIVFLILFILWAKQTNKRNLVYFVVTIALLGLIAKKDSVFKTLKSLNYINPLYSNSLQIAKEENEHRIGGSDSMIIRRIVWEGAIKLGLKYPLFGTGPETFGYTYYWVRPIAHNYTSETDFLYNKAHNEYLNFFANSGFIGLFAYLFLIFSIIKVLTKQKQSEVSTPLLLGFISILITNFIGFSVVNIALFFFLFPAIAISLNTNKQLSLKLPPLNLINLTIIILISIFTLNQIKNIWLADIYYGKGRSNVEANEIAIKLNPNEPLYHSQLGYLQALVASQIIYPQLPSVATADAQVKQKATSILNNYLENSIKQIQISTNTSPYNLNLQKNKARAELSLTEIDEKYSLQAENTLINIIKLSPTDPSNTYNLGVFYQTIGQKSKAEQQFQKTLELYPLHQGAKDQLDQF